ncbi:MAG: UDP-N-acetylglucosamine 1-carboxyvinyltransferase [Gemmatimonadetes bacterium]|nr:UDP-N-acetylglucosamine 1-carboxyvinyltransferase [Gemmatimonadota bacterium]
MATFVVRGGKRLAGTVRPAGNKNAALPMMAAALLTDEPVVLENVPRIRDVETMRELLAAVGTEAEWEGPSTLRLVTPDLRTDRVDPALAGRIRASVLLAGPALARARSLKLPPPGGDVIGRRRLDTHFMALQALGAEIEASDAYLLRTKGLRGREIFLDEPSVTATENALMASTLAQGSTILRNAATEPHVRQLCHLLNAMGASISGIGTNELRTEGVETLHGATARVEPDHIEVGSFIGLAATTRSELTIGPVVPAQLDSVCLGFGRLGICWELRGEMLRLPGDQNLEIQMDFGERVPTLADGPWPAFPPDLISIATVVATQCRGIVLIHEKMFESRLFFVDKLVSMGARIVLCDPHRAVVVGPSPLQGVELESPDIRAGMAMLIAALGAEGESRIHNIGQIERGYERIDERLRALGAEIERVD